MNKKPRWTSLKTGAIVWGGHFHALGLVRQLAAADIPVVVLDHEPCISRFSKYTKRFIRSPRGDDTDRCLQFFRDLAVRQGFEQWVVFPSDDEGLYFLSRQKQELEHHFRITTPDWETVQYTYDKRLTYSKASSIDLPVPKTFIPKNREDVLNLDWEFPLILKPAIMRTFKARTGRKVLRISSRGDLIRLYDYACTCIPCDEILIQDEIPQAYKHLYSYCPWFKEGRTRACVIGRRPRQHPMEFGHASTYAVTADIPELERLGARFLRFIDFYGICEVEFLYDIRDGRYKMLEVNPRIWGWHTLAEAAGMPLGYFLYMDQTGTLVEKTKYAADRKWMRLLTDIPTSVSAVLSGKISVTDYCKSLRGEKSFAVFSKEDPLPFLAELLMLPYLWKKRGF